MKTKEQLFAEGTLLRGNIVPDWFKARSDGCSVEPFKGKVGAIGRFINYLARLCLQADQAKAACFIHDFHYYLVAVQWPRYSPEWKGARLEADAYLKENRRRVARNPLFGLIYSLLYFRAVRVAGRWFVKPLTELAVPPTKEDIAYVESLLDFPLTKQAISALEHWKGLIDES